MPITDEQLAHLHALCQAATPGPWTVSEGWHGDNWEVRSPGMTFPVCSSTLADTRDLDFIVAARKALPLLLEEIVRLRG